MPERYYPDDSNSIDDALDELLCEYVDGTMDPDVCTVFEEYLATEPHLAAHVRQLCETRNLLCTFGACRCASASLQVQLRMRLAGELARKNHSSLVISHGLGNMAFLTSAVGLMLIVGMMAGLVTAVQRTTSPDSQSLRFTQNTTHETARNVMAARNDTHVHTEQSFRLENLRDADRSAFLGPISSLPVVANPGYMTPAGLRTASSDLP